MPWPRPGAASEPVPGDRPERKARIAAARPGIPGVADGYLSGIEYAWYGDEMPIRLPSTDRLAIEAE